MKQVLIHNREDMYEAFSVLRILYRDSSGNATLSEGPVKRDVSLVCEATFSEKQSFYESCSCPKKFWTKSFILPPTGFCRKISQGSVF